MGGLVGESVNLKPCWRDAFGTHHTQSACVAPRNRFPAALRARGGFGERGQRIRDEVDLLQHRADVLAVAGQVSPECHVGTIA